MKNLSVDELFAIIKDELKVDDTLSGVRFKSNKKAEFIERALYLCPVCGAISSFRSEKNRFRCEKCGLQAEYTANMILSSFFVSMFFPYLKNKTYKIAAIAIAAALPKNAPKNADAK